MAASTTDIREWARREGLEVKAKGPVGDDVRARYAEAHADGGTVIDYPPAADGPGVDGDQGDVPVAVAELPPPPAPAAAVDRTREGERTPVRPPRERGTPGGAWRKLRQAVRGEAAGKAPAAGKARQGKRLPRISLAGLIEDAWGQMAWASAPMPPMQRLLQAQAPFAGIALDDAFAGTVVDHVLQPVARAEDKAKAVGGLMFPPMALMLTLATAPVPEYVEGTDPPQFVFPEPSTQHKAALMTLRWSLMLWSEAGAARLEEYRARAEANAERGAQADRFMAWILGYDDQAPAADGGQLADAVNAEDEAVKRAQQMFGG